MALRFPKPGPAAGLDGRTPGRAQSGQERVKGTKMAGLFCSPRHHAEACPLPPGPRSRFRRPRWHPARPSLLPWSRSLANLLDLGAAGRPTRSFGAAAGPSASRSVCGPGRRLLTTVAAPPLSPSRPPRAFPAAQRAMGVATVPSSGQCDEQHVRDPPNWAQRAGEVLCRWFSNLRVQHTFLGSSSQICCWPLGAGTTTSSARLPRLGVDHPLQYTICPADKVQRINCDPDKVPTHSVLSREDMLV
ncbi:hypothetical protein NN561_000283 [Cricetulus griseus]